MEECKVCLKFHEKCFNEEGEYIIDEYDNYLICSKCSLVSKFYDGLKEIALPEIKSIFLKYKMRNLDNKKVQKYRKTMSLLIEKLNDEICEQLDVNINTFVSLIITNKCKNQKELITFLMGINKIRFKEQCIDNIMTSVKPVIMKMIKVYNSYIKLLKHKCLNCGCSNGDAKLKKCERCKSAYYCSLECNSADWKKHKKFCCSV